MEPILLAEKLHAGYQDHEVLRSVSLSISEGEKVLLIGPNGCGKSTLLKVLAGALPVWQGHVYFKNQDVSSLLGQHRIIAGIGYLMQTDNIFPSLSVEENLHLSFWNDKGDFSERRDWVLAIFPILKILLSRRAGFLSGGERQALAISMILMQQADLLLLDEPTAGLSPKAAAGVLQAIQDVHSETQVPLIIVEHQLKLVRKWVTRGIVMNQGRIKSEIEDPEALIDHDRLQEFYF